MPRERAIVVTPRVPWPQDDGGRIVQWQTVWSAAQRWDVTLLALVPPEEMALPIPPEAQALGLRVERIPHRPPATWAAALAGLFGPWPFPLSRYRNPRLAHRLRELVAAERPRFVLFNHLHTGVYAADARPAAVVLFEHNIEYLWLERFAESVRNPLQRRFLRGQAGKMRRVETRLCAAADLVLAIQPEEADLLRNAVPGARIESLPLGLAPSRFADPAPIDPPVVLVVGSWNWIPNAQGLRRFLVEGARALLEAGAPVRIRVVGKGMSSELVEEVRSAGADPVGYVDDIRAELVAARLMIVPLWVGAGLRVKIVEAFACGLPVVATPLACEGLGVEDGREILLGDTPSELSARACELLRDPARAREVGLAGRARAQTDFALSSVAERMNDWCAAAAARVPR